MYDYVNRFTVTTSNKQGFHMLNFFQDMPYPQEDNTVKIKSEDIASIMLDTNGLLALCIAITQAVEKIESQDTAQGE